MAQESRDRIFAEILQNPGDFAFDDKVAAVFPDMLRRSIPGYPAIIDMIETLTERYAQADTRLYDLGCSLGASSLSMLRGLKNKPGEIIAVDNSPAMIERCKKMEIAAGPSAKVSFCCEDIVDFPITNASVVVMNFTLQFIDPVKRCSLLKKICDGMNPNGIMILSEKVKFEDDQVNELLIDVYHSFKKSNGYSDLEISQKRTALENVLIPETIRQHRDRFIRAGFTSADVWFQCFNFMSMLAIK